MKKIYCFITSSIPNKVLVTALCEDGRVLANEVCSNEFWARNDIGLTSLSNHNIYDRDCPDGYDLVWVDDALNNEAIKTAAKKSTQITDLALFLEKWFLDNESDIDFAFGEVGYKIKIERLSRLLAEQLVAVLNKEK